MRRGGGQIVRDSGYWTLINPRRTGRRRLLQGMAVGAGAVALAACGGGSKKQEDLSGLVTPRAGTSAQGDPFAGARRGGILNVVMSGDPPTLDPYVQPATNTKAFASYVYSRLFRFKGGPGIKATEAKPTGDLAERA